MRIIKKNVVPLLVVAGFALLALSACNNDKAIPLSSGLIDGSNRGQILQSTKVALKDSSAGQVINTQFSSTLYVGRLKDLESRILLRFDTPDLFLDTSNVAAAKIKLPADSVRGQTGNLEASVHQITQTWREDSVKWGDQNFPVTFNPVALDRQQVAALKADTVTFNLTPQTVAAWFDTARTKRDTAGVMLQAPAATYIKEFFSRFSTLKQPYVELTLKRAGKSDTTVRRLASKSVFVFRRNAPLAAQRIYAGAGEKFLSSVFFNLYANRPDTIPRSATISRATLLLDVDAANSVFVDNDNTLSLALYRALDPYKLDTLTVNADSLFTLQIGGVRASDATVEFNVTNVVQAWVRREPKPEDDYFVLLPNFPEIALTRVAFFSKAAGAARAPRLRIEYTTPPK